MSQATIKDVARISGVSIGTVDRVLHNRGRVSQSSRDSVLKAIEELNYSPSQIARALVSRKNAITIGITFPIVESEFWREAQLGITYAENKLYPFGVKIILDSIRTYHFNEQLNSIDRLLSQGVNGVVFTALDDTYTDELERHIPSDVPYATVINDSIGSNRSLFVGPNDFSLGILNAKLVSLYCQPECNIVIIAPNATLASTQQRISGFLSKINLESLNITVLRIYSIKSQSEENLYDDVYNAAIDCIENYSNLNAIYVTNGLTEWAAAAVEASGKKGEILLFGHEYTQRVPYFINENIIAATIYQRPAQEWYRAIMMLYDHIAGNNIIESPIYYTECSIITKETLPFIQIGEMNMI